ncbi:MAG: hypothetical protein WD022_01210 [Balneolaceae bacterium]
MDLQAEKDRIKLEVDKVEDINLIKAIKNMLAYGKSKSHEEKLYPMSKETFYRRNEESRKAIEEDNLISQEEAKRYFTQKNEG